MRLLVALLFLPLAVSASPYRVISIDGEGLISANGGTRLLTHNESVNGPVTIQVSNPSRVHLLSDRGVQLIIEGGRVTLPADASQDIVLENGALAMSTGASSVGLLSGPTKVRAQGYLRLVDCQQACPTNRAGLFGSSSGGLATIEYVGGRVALRDRGFYAPKSGERPSLLPRESPEISSADRLVAAVQAKQEASRLYADGLALFKSGRFDLAKERFLGLRSMGVVDSSLAYYLGLCALEMKNEQEALGHLKQFAKEDPEGATARKVPELLTLLSSAELQKEVASALGAERELTNFVPEPNSVAVQPFVNRGLPEYASLAKGMAAMVIDDLGKVPGLVVLEREKVEKLSAELRLNASGLVDQSASVRVGRILRAEKIVTGTYGVE